MKKLNFNLGFKGLDGVEMPGVNIGKTLGSALAADTKGDPLKKWSIAQRIHNGEEIELDPSDIQMLKDFTTNSEGFTILAKAQILDILNAPDPSDAPLAKA